MAAARRWSGGEGEAGSKAAWRRLPVGRHALPREFVVRSQRDRMLDAMAQICAVGGYGAATVEAVIAHAGVSRRTFYDQFKDREDCFLAAYDAFFAQFLQRVRAAYGQTELSWAERVRAAIAALLSFLASEPAFARMCIVDVLAAGERALERYDAAVEALAGLLDEGRALMPDPEGLPRRTAADMIEGCAFLVREQILAGRTERVESLLPDFTYAALVPYLGPDQALHQAGANWSYPSAQMELLAQGGRASALEGPFRSPAEPPSAAPQRQRRWREQARRSRRERMLEAMIDTVAERGYHQTSMNDVAARAGVSRDTLRRQYRDKQGMFIAAHDWLLERLANDVAPAYQQPGSWPERISRAFAALLTAVAYRPQGARVAIIEVLAAGPQAHQRHLAAIERFAGCIDQARDETPNGRRLPPTLARVVAGATAARIHKQIAAGHGRELSGLHPQLLYLALLPYLGRRQAQQHAQTAHALSRPLIAGDHPRLPVVPARDVDEYLRGVEEPQRQTLQRLRATILEIVPEAEQVISYGLPAFRVRGKTVAGFAAFKNHLSYVPFSGSVLGQFEDDLKDYTMTKSSLHFDVDRPLPKALVKKLISARLAEADRRSR